MLYETELPIREDGTETPLDGSRMDPTEELRARIGVDDFVSKRQTTSS